MPRRPKVIGTDAFRPEEVNYLLARAVGREASSWGAQTVVAHPDPSEFWSFPASSCSGLRRRTIYETIPFYTVSNERGPPA